MMLKENLFWLNYTILVLIAFIGFIMPNLLKENILFGSRFPNEIIHHPDVKDLKKNYRHIYITVFIPFLVILGYFLNNSSSEIYLSLGIIVEVLLVFLIYAIYNLKAKELKKDLLTVENVHTQKKILTVDTGFSTGKYLISIWWFLPSLIIIIANVFVLVLFYNKIPDQIVLHIDFQGTPDLLVVKSYLHVLLMPITSFFILCIFVGVYFSIKLSKRELDSNRPETSKLKDKHFRLIWSDYSVIICTLLVAWMLFVSLHLNGLFEIPADIFKYFNLGLPFLILLSTIVLAIKTGQSGSKLKLNINESETGLNNVDDDSFWKFGMIYYNPQDPSIMVQKRFGVGWTLNFGRPASLVILIALIVFIVLINILTKK